MEPREFLAAIGTDAVPHGSRIAPDGASSGTFLDHLTGTEDQLRAWGCDEAICCAGLFHSVFGTEGFQGFTLPLSERAAVRDVIGARAEHVAYLNCVMDRHSLDLLVAEHMTQRWGPGQPPEGQLRARPNPATGFDGSERFGLSAQQFTDLVAVQLADHLEGFDNRAHPISSPFLAL